MSKRFVGIDLEGTEARVVILRQTVAGIDVAQAKRSYQTPEEAVMAIREILGGEIALGDHLVSALPCRVGLFRHVFFPFREKRKIEAALPLELASQLPVALEAHLISCLPPLARESDYQVDAMVVNRLEVDDLLVHFPDPEQNPSRIDIFPFALQPVLGQQEGILIYCRRLEVVVALVYKGRIWGYRLLPGTSESSEDEILDFISNQVSQLENAVGQTDLPLWLLGAGVTEPLRKKLETSGRPVTNPARKLLSEELDFEMAPAALLALAELRHRKKPVGFNFRSGEFSARGHLEVFRSRFLLVLALLAIIFVGGALNLHLGYLQKKSSETQLRQQTTELFKQIMPPGTPLVDAPKQVQSRLNELRQQVRLFGAGGQGVATVLQSISRQIDKKIPIDLDQFSYSSEEVRLEGVTDSFDSVNQIAERLGKTRLFSKADISNAKLTTDGKRVKFEIGLTFLGTGDEP